MGPGIRSSHHWIDQTMRWILQDRVFQASFCVEKQSSAFSPDHQDAPFSPGHRPIRITRLDGKNSWPEE